MHTSRHSVSAMAGHADSHAIERWAELSDDGLHRYILGRRWDDALPECVFIMLNPSTADATQDDPTIRRCINFAKSFGCGTLLVGNLYAYRATDPRELFKAEEPTGGPRNNSVLTDLLTRGAVTVAAWGARAKADRVAELISLPGANHLTALATTKDGAPRHPLYVPGSATPKEWKVTA